MIYFLLVIIPIILIREYIMYNEDEPALDHSLIDITEKEIANNLKLIQKYYIQHHIGEERMKDEEWMKKNRTLTSSQDVPSWRLYQILNSPDTQEGMYFRTLMMNYSDAFDDLKDLKRTIPDARDLNPNYLIELQKLNEEAQVLFPKVFIAINRDKKLNELI